MFTLVGERLRSSIHSCVAPPGEPIHATSLMITGECFGLLPEEKEHSLCGTRLNLLVSSRACRRETVVMPVFLYAPVIMFATAAKRPSLGAFGSTDLSSASRGILIVPFWSVRYTREPASSRVFSPRGVGWP